MLLAIFFPDFGAQKHGPCHHARTSLPGEEGRSAPHALCPLPALSAKQLSEIQNAIFRNSLRYCERQARTHPPCRPLKWVFVFLYVEPDFVLAEIRRDGRAQLRAIRSEMVTCRQVLKILLLLRRSFTPVTTAQKV